MSGFTRKVTGILKDKTTDSVVELVVIGRSGLPIKFQTEDEAVVCEINNEANAVEAHFKSTKSGSGIKITGSRQKIDNLTHYRSSEGLFGGQNG